MKVTAMKKVEVLSDEVNRVIVQVEGRSFPGIVLQGDQLFQLVSLARDLEPRHDELRKLILHYYELLMAHGDNRLKQADISSEGIIRTIRSKFDETGGKATVPLFRCRKGKYSFEAECKEAGVNVDNLGNEPFLPWPVFTETILLLRDNNGVALKGNATNHRLGSKGLPLDSVEGNIATKIYGKTIGDTVFRRITPVACIMIWAGICKNEPNRLVLCENYGALPS